MDSRKRSGPPYSDRHNRRLKSIKTIAFFQEVNNKFLEYLDLATNNDNEAMRTISQTTNDHNTYSSPFSEDQKHTFRANRLLNSLENSMNLSTSLENIQSKFGSVVFENGEDEKEEPNDNLKSLHKKQISEEFRSLFAYEQDTKSIASNSESEYDEFEKRNAELEKDSKFVNDIRRWAIKYIHTVPHIAIDDLLHTLKVNTNTVFPKNSKALLKTPRTTEIFDMDNGQYCHYGLKSAILKFIIDLSDKNINIDRLEILVSIDGAPLATSSEKGIWIISCSETILKNVEVVGIYHGKDKPSNCNDLLEMFCNEATNLINHGIEYNEKLYKIKLHALVCDTPAKAYVLNVKYHTGYWSCTKCTIKGNWIGNVCFPGEAGNKRTDLGFKENLYSDDGINDGYQKGTTNLADIPNFGMVSNVVLHYMHLVCLGVVLKLIELWTSDPINVYNLHNNGRILVIVY